MHPTHRLPDWLGGHPVTIRQVSMNGKLAGVEIIESDHAGVRLHIGIEQLVELPPVVPDEPGIGAYMVGEHLCVRIPAERQHRWLVIDAGTTLGFIRLTWSEVWALYGAQDVVIRRLVPEPEDDPTPPL